MIIAEIGINANGNVGDAIKLITMAKDCGCEAVKFQKRNVDLVYEEEFLNEKRESPWGTTQREQKEGLEFSEEEFKHIDSYCKQLGIEWFASAWDMASQRFLNKFDLKYNKVASAMITHLELVEMIAKENKLTFISIGLSTIKEIDTAIQIFEENNCPYVIMHCVSLYPCPDELCNLERIDSLKSKYSRKMYCKGVGYSNHSTSILACSIAKVIGASDIEIHVTLDRSSYGSDQSSSFEDREIRYIVRDCKKIESMVKSDRYKIEELERPIAKKLRYFEVLCEKG